MKTQLFCDLAPYLTAGGTFLIGILVQGVHPLLAAVVAGVAGLAYHWIDSKLP